MLILAGVSLNATIGENGIVTKAQEAKIAEEEAELWEQIQMILFEAAGRELEGQDMVDYVNAQFAERGLEATMGLTETGYAVTYGKYSRNVALLNKRLEMENIIVAVEGVVEDWVVEVKDDGTLKLVEYTKDKTGDIQIPNILGGKLVTEIGKNIFQSTSIKSVTIPEGIKIIGENVFLDCEDLSCEIRFPSSLEQIDSYAFYNCANITGDLNAIVKQNIKMGKNVFGRCSGLTGDVQVLIDTLEDSVTEITDGQFSGFSGITGTLKIPARITKIGNNAFYGCSSIGAIEFEEESQLQTIGDYAFYQCTTASNILNIPSNVTSIGQYAFYNCNRLTGLVLSDALTSIGQYAFNNCTSMIGTLSIPGGINEVSAYAFQSNGFTNLEFKTNGNTENLYIRDYAFQNSKNLVRITFPHRETSLGTYAFQSSPILSTIVNDSSIKIIGNRTFNSCSSLDTDFSDVRTIDEYAFEFCKALTQLPSSKSLTSIGDCAYSQCSINAMNIIEYLQNSYITSVGRGAFGSCQNLYGDLPDIIKNKNNVTIKLGLDPFSGTKVLKEKQLNLEGKTSIAANEFEGVTKLIDSSGNEITEIIIPKSVTSIGNNAFYGCRTITKMEIPDTVTYIGTGAFQQCDSLSDVKLPNNASITTIPANCFYGCDTLENIMLPGGITRIGASAFSWSGITSIDLTNIKTLDSNVFWTCKSLKTITLGNNLKTIGNSCFAKTSVLNIDLELPDTVTSIGTGVFELSGIKSVIIGNQINTIPNNSFKDCTYLTTVTCKSNMTSVGISAFQNCSVLETIDINWQAINSIGTNAFNSCGSSSETVQEVLLNRTCSYDVENSFLNSCFRPRRAQ